MNNLLKVSTKYGDHKGKVSIDGLDIIDGKQFLNKLASDYDIDLDKYMIIGVDIRYGSGGKGWLTVTLLAVDKSFFGDGAEYMTVYEYLSNNPNPNIETFELENAKIDDFFSVCKQFHLIALNSSLSHLIKS